MPNLTIDGRQLTVPDGTTILQAALAAGIDIPYYCYHPGLSIAGNCRICLVEVEKFPKPVIACNTAVAEGMVVYTQSEKTKEWERAVMEFLLINHPLDCPICDQAGECKLQEYSFRHGQPTTRFVEEKSHGPKRRDLGPGVVYDWERCIKCTRCIRFCEEVTKTGELGMFLRGVHEEVGIYPGKPLDNPYSGNVVDICPVGALTWRSFRFRSRVWFLTDVPSTCAGCARGCSVNVGAFRNEVYRVTPRINQAVNRWWICDVGREWGERLRTARPERLSGPRFTRGAEKGPWATAIEEAGDLLAGASAGRAAVLASPRASVEDLFLAARIASGPLGGAPVFLPVHESGENDDLLIRRDRSPNRRGAELVLGALAGGARPIAELERRLADGEVDTLFALGPGLVGPVSDEPPPLTAAALAKARQVIVLDAFHSPLADAATLLLPVTTWGESAGTLVNFAGRVQWSAAALAPAADCRPAFVLLGDLLARLSGEGPAPSRQAVQAALSSEVPAFAGIDWDALPASSGQDLAGADAAAAAPTATGTAAKLLASGVAPEGS